MERRDLDAPGDADFCAVYSPSLLVPSRLVTASSHPAEKLVSVQLYCQKKHFRGGKKKKSVWKERKKKRNKRSSERKEGREDTLQRLTRNGLPSKLRGQGSVRQNRTRVFVCRVKPVEGPPWSSLSSTAHPTPRPPFMAGLGSSAHLIRGRRKRQVWESGGLLTRPCPAPIATSASRWPPPSPNSCPGSSFPICDSERDPSSSHNPGLV